MRALINLPGQELANPSGWVSQPSNGGTTEILELDYPASLPRREDDAHHHRVNQLKASIDEVSRQRFL